jgi:chromate reductase
MAEPSREEANRAMDAFGANHHLRQSLVFLDMPAMQQPEAYVGARGRAVPR